MKVAGTLVRVRHTTDDGMWSVADLETDDGTLITIVGALGVARVGQHIDVQGKWARHPVFGRQLKLTDIDARPPVTAEGMEKYLAESQAHGIGPVLAKRLVAHFGPAVLDIIENQPERLTEVEGIGKIRLARIVGARREHTGEEAAFDELRQFLYSYGVSRAYHTRIQRKYGPDVVRIITSNPYALARDIHGIGFSLADRVAAKLGISGDDPRRVRAGIRHALDMAGSEGHLYLPVDELATRSTELLGAAVNEDLVRHQIDALCKEGRLVLESAPEAGHAAVFSKRAHRAECGVAHELRRLLDTGLGDEVDPAAMNKVEFGLGVTLAPQQRKAVLQAFAEAVLVITGGPGTGKTTLVNAICALGNELDYEIVLAAPTGRAAKRMTEATGHEAKTIHRLLEFSWKLGGFQRHREAPLEGDIVVIDESSMLDIYLMEAVLLAIPSGCIAVFVGDVEQLPSVGPGNVLSDLIKSGELPVVRLDTVFRQSQESGIVRNAHRINQGLLPEHTPPAGGPQDFYFVEAADAEDVLDKTIRVVTQRAPSAFGLDPVQDVQVLVPMKKGPVGTENLNVRLQALLNPPPPGDQGEATLFRPGDRVMQLYNDYDKEVFNGDVGIVRSCSPRRMVVEMDGRNVEYERDDFDTLTLAYAITAHKSQGSEYPAVVIPLTTAHFVMLQRNLLYTAVTRGKRLVVLIGMKRAVQLAVRNVDPRLRHTRLAARLRAAP
jgi:exodeoxyribonuclease V alpha subunit